MTIHISKDVENAINAAVRSGQFASADEMVAKLVWDYARTHPVQQPAQPVESGAKPNLGSIGAMRTFDMRASISWWSDSGWGRVTAGRSRGPGSA